MSLRGAAATKQSHFREIATDFVLATFGIAALPLVAPKKQQYHWPKDVGAVPRTAQQARSGIGPYELKAVSSVDNPGYGRGQSLAMTRPLEDTVSRGEGQRISSDVQKRPHPHPNGASFYYSLFFSTLNPVPLTLYPDFRLCSPCRAALSGSASRTPFPVCRRT